jgi:hypothetical protein
MTRTTPFLLMILHLLQIFFADALTFIFVSLVCLSPSSPAIIEEISDTALDIDVDTFPYLER